MLYTPDFSKLFILETNASGVALGTVLTQKVDRENRSVAYGSHRFLDHETQYATIECECLAIQWGVKLF